MFQRLFDSSSGVHDLLYLQLCTNRANVSNCSVLRLELNSNLKTEHLVLFVCIIGYDARYIQCQISQYIIAQFYMILGVYVALQHVGL